MQKTSAIILALAAAAPALAGNAAADTRVSFASGVDYSSGDYGQTVATEVVSVPLIAKVNTRHWAFRASLPYLSIDGPADVADTSEGGGSDGAGGTGGQGTVTRTGTETGFGDLTLSATRSFARIHGSDVYFDVSGRVRLPTGDDERGLGVGATDYMVSGELGKASRGGGGYLNVGRRFLGDRGTVDRQDGWQTTAGGWLRASENTNLGLFYFWRDPSIDGNKSPSELGAFVSYRISPKLRLSMNASGGLSDASPEYSAGVRLTWRSDWTNREGS